MTPAEPSQDGPMQPGRVAELSAHLQRIAAEVRAAGVMSAPGSPSVAVGPGSLVDLSPRQLEIVNRLMRGERVPLIARELYLSASTVRNHLTTIFRKFAVHSQTELLARLRNDTWGDPPTHR